MIFAILQFETSSLMNWILSLFQTWILQSRAVRKIQFKLGKNPVNTTWYFKLENCTNQVQIKRRTAWGKTVLELFYTIWAISRSCKNYTFLQSFVLFISGWCVSIIIYKMYLFFGILLFYHLLRQRSLVRHILNLFLTFM